jgi:CheY-like chemotaxis protein
VIGPASTVREALDLLHTNAVDAAILDANLPDGDVTPVAEQLIDRNVPFIINTGVAVPLQLRRFPGLLVFRKPTPSSIDPSVGGPAADLSRSRRALGSSGERLNARR